MALRTLFMRAAMSASRRSLHHRHVFRWQKVSTARGTAPLLLQSLQWRTCSFTQTSQQGFSPWAVSNVADADYHDDELVDDHEGSLFSGSVLLLPLFEAASRMLQVIRGFRHYDRKKHDPDMSFLVENPCQKLIPIPMAVKKGEPLRSIEAKDKKLLLGEDIWVVRQDEKEVAWKPPKTHIDVLGSPGFKVHKQLLDMAIRKTIPGSTELFDFEKDMDDDKEFDDIVSLSVSDKKDEHIVETNRDIFITFLSSVNRAMVRNWCDGDGRVAVAQFLEAAWRVCRHHIVDLKLAGRGMQSYMRTYTVNYGGSSPLNEHTSRYALKKVQLPEIDFEDQVEEFLNSDVWVNDINLADTDLGWFFRSAGLDTALCIRQHVPGESTKVVGFIVGEVKKAKSDFEDAEKQAFVQSLKGLLYGPQTAAMVIAPNEAVFMDIAVEQGFILTKKKRYHLVVCSEWDLAAYQDLFQDLVLYMWNTYFANEVIN